MTIPSLSQALRSAIEANTQSVRDFLPSLRQEMRNVYNVLEKVLPERSCSFSEHEEGLFITLYYDDNDEEQQTEFSIVLRKKFNEELLFDLSHPCLDDVHTIGGGVFQLDEDSVQKMVIQLSEAIMNYLSIGERLKYLEVESQQKAQMMLFKPVL